MVVMAAWQDVLKELTYILAVLKYCRFFCLSPFKELNNNLCVISQTYIICPLCRGGGVVLVNKEPYFYLCTSFNFFICLSKYLFFHGLFNCQ